MNKTDRIFLDFLFYNRLFSKPNLFGKMSLFGIFIVKFLDRMLTYALKNCQ